MLRQLVEVVFVMLATGWIVRITASHVHKDVVLARLHPTCAQVASAATPSLDKAANWTVHQGTILSAYWHAVHVTSAAQNVWMVPTHSVRPVSQGSILIMVAVSAPQESPKCMPLLGAASNVTPAV